MAPHRGRPSKTLREQTLKQDTQKIVEEFRGYPLRQPVDSRFQPYYKRILDGDLAAVVEYREYYCTSQCLDDSFYEFIGRLVPLQSLGAAKQIVSEIARLGFDLLDIMPPDYVLYEDWYDKLKYLCGVARDFIRDQYKADDSVKREPLWQAYMARARDADKLKAFLETRDPETGQLPSLYEQVERFWMSRLVPKQLFFELAESQRPSNARAERDRRCVNRRFLWTPSSIARKYAAAIAGVSVSAMSHHVSK